MEYPKVEKELFDVDNENLQKLASLFPSAVKDGQLDINALKEELGQFEEVGQEKYELNWAGKQNAKKEARKNVLGKTLRYIEGDGVNENTTQNLYIEGDNLEVLKLLRKNYYGSIKMIYIDPPYNTGSDEFLYRDNFTLTQEELEIMQGEIDENGLKLVKNTKDSARFHTKWINEIYPLLRLSKDLLTEDGAIFISIDDNEVGNLKKLCDEIYGETNFINLISLNAKVSAGASGGGEDKKLKKNIEYILFYAKNSDVFPTIIPPTKETELMNYIEQMKINNKSFKYINILYKADNETYFKTIKDGDGNDITINKINDYEIKTIKQVAQIEGITEKEVYYKYFDKIMTTTNAQTSIRDRVWDATGDENDMYKAIYTPRSGKNKGIPTELIFMGKQKVLVIWLKDSAISMNGVLYKSEKIGTFWDGFSWINVSKEGNIKFDNGKKPIALVQQMMNIFPENNNMTILDFFSGSATTAHACIQNNVDNNKKHKFIMVQLPQVIQPTSKSNKEYIKYLAGENIEPIITEIGKERIRRAGQKIKEEIEQGNTQLKLGEEPKKLPDIGFKVFRVGETTLNWEKLRLQGKDIAHDYLPNTSDKDRLDFTPDYQNDLNVVYEIMLRQEGLALTSNIENLTDIGSRTYLVADSYLISLEETITPQMIEKLSALNPLPFKFIFRDSAFDDDIVFKDETFRKLNALIDKNTKEGKKAYTVEFI